MKYRIKYLLITFSLLLVWNCCYSQQQKSNAVEVPIHLVTGFHTNSTAFNKERTNMRKGHKPNCQCCCCKNKRGELKGKNHPLFGRKRTKQHSKNISKALTGRIIIWGDKISKAKMGHPQSNTGRTHFKKGVPPWNKGKHHSKETKERISMSKIGTICSDETKSKMSLNRGGTGISYENSGYSGEFNPRLKEKIRKRDNYRCQKCGITKKQHLKKYKSNLEVHHIDYDKENCKEENLITTCKRCNVRANKNRKYWEKYFKEKQIARGIV